MGFRANERRIRTSLAIAISCYALCLFALLGTTIAGSAHADGKVFPRFDASAHIPDQQALIHYADGVETLAIETRFEGTGTEFAWIVPTPSVPEVSATTTGVFPTLREITHPSLHAPDLSGLSAIMVVLTFVCLAFKGRERLTLPALVLILVLLVFCVGLFLPSLGKSRGSGNSNSEVEVIDRSIIGSYDVATVQARSATELLSWLSTSGFATAGDIEPVVRQYINDGWTFVAMKLRRESADSATMTPHPMVFRFPTPTPVYPLRLTGVGNPRVEISLYVCAHQMASARDFRHEYCGILGRPHKSETGTFRGDPHPLWNHPELSRLAGSASVLTKLVGTLDAGHMVRDAEISFEPPRTYRNWFYTKEAAAGVATAIGSAIMFVVSLVLVVRANRSGDTSRAIGRIFLKSLAVGCIVGALLRMALPTTSQVLSREQRDAYWHARRWLDDLELTSYRTTLSEKAGTSRIELARAFMREDWLRFNAEWSESGAPSPDALRSMPREEDSPGNYTLREVPEGVEITRYWPFGGISTFVLFIDAATR